MLTTNTSTDKDGRKRSNVAVNSVENNHPNYDHNSVYGNGISLNIKSIHLFRSIATRKLVSTFVISLV